MKRTMALLLALGTLSLAGPSAVNAQQYGTTVQLPTFSFFSVSTTVLAPDSGRGYMGMLSRAGRVRPTYGAPLVRNRGLSNFANFAGMSVSAQVHDLRWMDEMLLGRVEIVEPQPDEHSLASRSKFAQQLAQETVSSAQAAAYGSMHVNDIRQRKAAERAAAVTEFLVKAEDSRERGKLSLSKYYLQRAAMQSAGELKQQIEALIRDTEYNIQQGKPGGGQ